MACRHSTHGHSCNLLLVLRHSSASIGLLIVDSFSHLVPPTNRSLFPSGTHSFTHSCEPCAHCRRTVQSIIQFDRRIEFFLRIFVLHHEIDLRTLKRTSCVRSRLHTRSIVIGSHRHMRSLCDLNRLINSIDLRSLVVAPQLFSSGDNSSSGNNSIDTVVPVAALNRLLLPLQ